MKKILSLALALALVWSLFAACGAKEQAATPDPDAAAASQEEASADQEAAAPEVPEEAATAESAEAPADSAEEQPAAPQSAISFPLDETETLTYWHDYNTQIIPYVEGENYDNLPAMLAAEEITNVHISNVVVSQDAESEQFNLMAASGDYTDMIMKATDLYSKGAIAVLDDNVIIDLTPYLDEYGPNYLAALDSVDGYIRDATTDDGRIPTFITVYANGLDPSQGIWIRKDLLEKAGLEVPHTYDEFTEVMRGLRDYGIQEPL